MAASKFLVDIVTDGDVIASGVTLTGQSDWNATSGGSEILNKPTLAPSTAEENVQSDWNETNSAEDSFILNKPADPTLYVISVESSDRNMVTADKNKYIYNDNDIKLTFTSAGTFNVPIGSSGVFKRVEDDGAFQIIAGTGVDINGETSVTYAIDGASDKDTNGCTWIKIDDDSYHLIGAVTKI